MNWQHLWNIDGNSIWNVKSKMALSEYIAERMRLEDQQFVMIAKVRWQVSLANSSDGNTLCSGGDLRLV